MSVRVAPLQPDEWADDVINALSVMATPDRIERRDRPEAGLTADTHQRMDLVFAIGSHGRPAMVFNTFGVHIDHDNEQQER